jgi:DNA polymerase III epsilon subunit-like protein
MSGNKSSNRCPVPLPCSQCTPIRSFLSSTALANHRRSKHAVPCTLTGCTKTFPNQEEFEKDSNSTFHGSQRKVPLQHFGKGNHILSSQDGLSATHEPFYDTVGETPDKNIEFLTPVLVGRASNDNHNQSSKPTTYPIPSTQKPARIRNTPIHPVPSRSSKSSQKQRQDVMLSLNRDQHHVRDESHQYFHAIYSIKDCYLISTPREGGGQPLVAPLVLDPPKKGFDLALLVPAPRQLQQHELNAASLGSCESCGFRFTTCESFTTHFGSSLCKTTLSCSATRDSSSVAQGSENVTPDGKTAKCGSSSESRKGKEPKTQALNTQLTYKWTTIPTHQQPLALIALTSRCHSRAILTANKYTPKSNHIKFVGEIPSQTPAYDPMNVKRSAVALDCEMVGVGDNKNSEIARISAIDYLTGEILIDTLVEPLQRVTDWRTKYSGITKATMTAAVTQGRILKGWPGARVSLFNHIDANTVIVGHALNHDLIALGIQHQRVVDSAILTSGAVGSNIKRRWGLKDLCNQLLGIEIQNQGKAGHDSVEDAFAAREVVLWCIEHPDRLKQWGLKQRKDHYSKKTLKPKAKAGAALQRNRPPYLGIGRYHSDEDDEILRWSDIAEDCGWPHPDTGYDPWSD